jgi:BA14K-like protein
MSALASVEGVVGAKPLPDRFGAVVASTEGPVTARMSEQDVEALLARADGLLQSGDIASARQLLEQAADTGDAEAVATAHGSAAISRLSVLVLVLNDVTASADALGPSDKAVVPAQSRQTRNPVSRDPVVRASPEKGEELRPPEHGESQPLARADVARTLPIATFRRLVRAAATQQPAGPYGQLPPAGGHLAGSQAWLDYCSAKFRSFDSKTGTYQDNSGKQRYCR